MSILLGDGDGTFRSPVNLAAGSNPRFTIVGDLNGDGKPDIAVSTTVVTPDLVTTTYFVAVFMNNGDGTFAAARMIPAALVTDGIAIVDFNGDG